MSRLTREGEELRQAIGAAGIELTPNELADGLAEADERIGGNGGICRGCSADDVDLRFGWCLPCCNQAEDIEELAGQPLGKEPSND